MIERKIYRLFATLLLCILQVAGIGAFAQDTHRTDSLIKEQLSVDSLVLNPQQMADSIAAVNQKNMKQLDSLTRAGITKEASADSAKEVPETPKKIWVPNSNTATWLAVVIPGGGQIYNRKYWKLPIIYGGFVGCAYALSWNNKMYKDYSQAYLDIMDGNPKTNSYLNFVRGNMVIKENDTYFQGVFKRQKDFYRRYRDISIFAFIGVYLISIIDAYVDAELSNFDIGPDISMKVEPAIMNDRNRLMGSNTAVGLQWSFKF